MADILSDAAALSHFSFFWGVLAESTTQKNQRILHVYVPALTPMRNGDISDKGSVTTVDFFNVLTQSREKTDIHLSRTIEAEYLGFQSGQDIPDMYKGQQVLVLNYARGDRWFWIPVDRDNYIKTFEHARISCADVAMVHKAQAYGNGLGEEEERKVGLNDDNTYFLEIDTKYRKRILISTAASDGEKYRYFIRLDANEHVLELWDSLADEQGFTSVKDHNTIKIESDPHDSGDNILKGRITLQNEAHTSIVLEDQDLKVMVPRDVIIDVGRNVIHHTAGSHQTTIDQDVHLLIRGNVIREVWGFIKAKVIGMYDYFFGSNRTEEVQVNYILKTTGLQDNWFGSRVTKVNTSDLLQANQITVTASTNLTMTGTQQVSLVSEKLISMASKTITTSTHIFGCCGCIAH